jgi:hypothetical protein
MASLSDGYETLCYTPSPTKAEFDGLTAGVGTIQLWWLYASGHAETHGRRAAAAGGVCQTSCPPISCGVSDFRGADFGLGVKPDGSGWLPVAGFS